ncbi:MAG: DUF4179 domain-containing protein [Bacillota bacterium]
MSAEMETELEQSVPGMRNDRERVDRAIERLPAAALDGAIRRGLEQGRKQVRRGTRKRLSLIMSVSALCMILLLTAFVRVSPAFAAVVRDIPGLSGFVELIEGDKSLLAALDNEFIQPVNVSVEKNGYKLTVDGIMADEGRLVILYSGEGPGVTDQSDIDNYKLLDGNGEQLKGGIYSSHFPSGDSEKVATTMHNYIDAIMDEDIELPESIRFSVQLQEQWLEIQFPVEHDRFKGMREAIILDKTFEVAGQRFTIKDAVITPLQVKLTVVSDPSNEKHSNSFINIALMDEKGRRYTSKGGFGELDTEMTFHFQSSYFEQPKELTLVAEGLHLSERNKTFVINTETGETIAAPDQRIALDSIEQTADGIDLRIGMSNLDKTDATLGYTFFEHKGTFKDAGGKTYSILDRSGVQIEWSASGATPAYYYYRIPKAEYKQPLTFDVKQYPGYVLEPVSIKIK